MKKLIYSILLSLLFFHAAYAIPQYYCTAANEPFFPRLINLIGSIQKYNYDELMEIAVFDLGLSQEQIGQLEVIDKVKVYQFKEKQPDFLMIFHPPDAKPILGWYAWKPVAIKEALEMFPYVLWLDAGTTVRKPIGELFSHIVKEGYFVCTLGGRNTCGTIDSLHSVDSGTTAFGREQFQLEDPSHAWILQQEMLMGGIVGSTRNGGRSLIDSWYQLTKDMRYFADDGSAPQGYGHARHDEAVLSILTYQKGLHVYEQDCKQNTPMMLSTEEGSLPFFITWHRPSVKDDTSIYSSRDDISSLQEYMDHLHYIHSDDALFLCKTAAGGGRFFTGDFLQQDRNKEGL